MFHHRKIIAALALGALAALSTGCADRLFVEPDPFEIPEGHARMFMQANLGSTMIDELVIEVTAADIAEPLVFNAEIVDGVASADLVLPAGSDRTIAVAAFDLSGIVTHRGETVVSVHEGENETVAISLLPSMGDQVIEVTFASFQVWIEQGLREFLPGAEDRLRILVRDQDGMVHDDQQAIWGSTNPNAVSIDLDGTFQTIDVGTAEIAAVYGGVAAITTIQVLTQQDYVLGRNLTANVHAYEAGHWAPQYALSTASFEHSAWPANWGMVEASALPRQTLQNDGSSFISGSIEYGWSRIDWAKWHAGEALRLLADGVQIGEAGEHTAAATVHARFALAMAHATEALLYDQGVVVEDWLVGQGTGDLVPYGQVMNAALAHLDEAITIASNEWFQVPDGWHTLSGMTSDGVVRLLRSYRAQFRANVARTPAERAAVDWLAVIADVDAGITADFELWYSQSEGLGNLSLPYRIYPNWAAAGYHLYGMADQTGQYQSWVAAEPMSEAQPFDLVTPDLRFPQGETQADQQASPGAYICWDNSNVGNRAERGTWRWSNYRHCRFQHYLDNGWQGHLPALTIAELRLLKAEGLYRQGDLAGAAALVNETRVPNGGLSAIGSDGSNADCVPRLPDGTCGDLWEGLKWEKRLETSMTGFARFFFDSRGWGDLVEGTALHFPVPAHVLLERGLGVYTFGGSGEGAAGAGTYGF